MVTLLVVVYFSVLAVLSAYGLHRSHLVWTCMRQAKKLNEIQQAMNVKALPQHVAAADVPHVTIQLPLYNEATVADRLLDYVSRIEYPREKLEIQVLDDSTDETRSLLEAHVEDLKDTGLDIVYIHRTDRTGYKAGALDNGLSKAKGELIGVFDADFLPNADFLQKLVPHFEDPGVGMVQARWGHLNRDHSLLTRVQSLMLDGHHLIENRARYASGWLFNFSGTGGMWRKEAIYSAGGWQHDTLTEDLDLSYRAQLAGWKFAYRADVVTPAELPEDVSALRAQQYRWAKGTVQTARKLLKRVLHSDLSLGQRIEAMFHLTPHFAYPLMVLLSVLLLPALILLPGTDARTMLLIDLPLCVGTTGSLVVFYMMAERLQGRSRWGAIKHLPALLAIGAGLAPHLSKAVFEGMRHMSGEFVRTPKAGTSGCANRYKARADLPMLEGSLAILSAMATVVSVMTQHWFATPFAALFTFGYGYVATLVVREQFVRRSAGTPTTPSSGSLPAPAPSQVALG